jgi:hypothetical protein
VELRLDGKGLIVGSDISHIWATKISTAVRCRKPRSTPSCGSTGRSLCCDRVTRGICRITLFVAEERDSVTGRSVRNMERENDNDAVLDLSSEEAEGASRAEVRSLRYAPLPSSLLPHPRCLVLGGNVLTSAALTATPRSSSQSAVDCVHPPVRVVEKTTSRMGKKTVGTLCRMGIRPQRRKLSSRRCSSTGGWSLRACSFICTTIL